MSPITRLLAVVTITLLSASHLFAQDRKIYVKDARFADAVSQQNKQYGSKFIKAGSPDKFAGPTVFLWTLLAGDSTAFAQLKKDKKLPIKHIWLFRGSLHKTKVEANTDQESLDETPVGTLKPIDVGTIRDLNALELELKSTGSFDWRTWSHRPRVCSGLYTVQVCYADGTPVTNGKAPYSFTVRYVQSR